MSAQIRALEIRIDYAVKVQRTLRKAERAAAAAHTTTMLNELGRLYRLARAANELR